MSAENGIANTGRLHRDNRPLNLALASQLRDDPVFGGTNHGQSQSRDGRLYRGRRFHTRDSASPCDQG